MLFHHIMLFYLLYLSFHLNTELCNVAMFRRHHLELRVKYINGTYALDLTDEV